jgi:hypothetical protein
MIRKDQKVIDSLPLWELLAGPKSSVQWQDHRSAKESAKAWLGTSAGAAIPSEIVRVLSTHPDFSQISAWEAEPECLVAIDEFTGPANIDVLVSATDRRGTFAMAVEAKAEESFGPLLGDAFTAALERRLTSPTSKGLARLEQLATSILSPAARGKPRAQHLRYQLLTATAAALASAASISADRAVVMIHEFRTSRTSEKYLARNRRDLVRYLTRLGFESPERIFDGFMIGPVFVPGGAAYLSPAALYFGKAVREL